MDPIHSLKLPSIHSISICTLETELGPAVQCINADALRLRGPSPLLVHRGGEGTYHFL